MFIFHGIRDKVLAASKKRRLTTSDFGFQHSAPIYVNEYLWPEDKVLLWKAAQKKKGNNWKFLWVSQEKILMRKAENGGVVKFINEADLSLIE